MRLLDSNIIIYASNPEFGFLRKKISKTKTFISAISKVEVLGYYKLKKEEEEILREFFEASPGFPVSENIIERAIAVRKEKNISVADSIIAATALENHLELVTRNTDDFKGI